MTIGDFMFQAGFWQWVGVIAVAGCLSNVRLITIKRCTEEPK